MQDLRQSDSYADYMIRLGWEVEKISNVFCYVKKIPILGAIIKIQRPDNVIQIDKIKKLIESRGATNIYIEPKDYTQHSYFSEKGGFKRTNLISLPSKTITINLLQTEKELLASFHHKTRYNIGLSERKGVKVMRSKDINKFANLWQKYSKSWGMYLPQQKEIKSLYDSFSAGNAAILIAEKKGEILGGVLFIATGEITYYMYAFSSLLGKRLFVPTLLAWKGILLAKKEGKKIFDFGGIYDDRYPIKTWLGFTRFKRGFGGVEVEYPGVLVKSLLPFGITF